MFSRQQLPAHYAPFGRRRLGAWRLFRRRGRETQVTCSHFVRILLSDSTGGELKFVRALAHTEASNASFEEDYLVHQVDHMLHGMICQAAAGFQGARRSVVHWYYPTLLPRRLPNLANMMTIRFSSMADRLKRSDST